MKNITIIILICLFLVSFKSEEHTIEVSTITVDAGQVELFAKKYASYGFELTQITPSIQLIIGTNSAVNYPGENMLIKTHSYLLVFTKK